MLDRNDLRIVPYDTKLLGMINAFKQADLQEFVESWNKIPELRSLSVVKKNYELLNKEATIRQITVIDWPEGLHMYQIGQIQLTQFTRLSRKSWNVLKLSGRINRLLDMESIKVKMENYLSNFCFCKGFARHDADTEAYVFSFSIVEDKKKEFLLSDMKFANLIYFPETNLIIMPNMAWKKKYDSYYKEALLDTFSADAVEIEAITVGATHTWNDFAQYKTSENILGGLQNNQMDANPLDVRQKRQMGSEVHRTTEQKRRIVPMDLDEVEDKYDEFEADMSWKSVVGSRRLHVNLKLPLNMDKPNHPSGYKDDDISVSVTMVGTNVGEGIAELIRQGKIEANPPLWLKGVSVSGAKRLVVNSEGAFQELREENDKVVKRTLI